MKSKNLYVYVDDCFFFDSERDLRNYERGLSSLWSATFSLEGYELMVSGSRGFPINFTARGDDGAVVVLYRDMLKRLIDSGVKNYGSAIFEEQLVLCDKLLREYKKEVERLSEGDDGSVFYGAKYRCEPIENYKHSVCGCCVCGGNGYECRVYNSSIVVSMCYESNMTRDDVMDIEVVFDDWGMVFIIECVRSNCVMDDDGSYESFFLKLRELLDRFIDWCCMYRPSSDEKVEFIIGLFCGGSGFSSVDGLRRCDIEDDCNSVLGCNIEYVKRLEEENKKLKIMYAELCLKRY